MRNLKQYGGFKANEVLKPITQTGEWVTNDNSLYKRFVFADFNEAMEFMSQVAKVCNQMNHHPKWTNIYKTVECWLRTHDVEAITDADRELAKAMDRIALSLTQ